MASLAALEETQPPATGDQIKQKIHHHKQTREGIKGNIYLSAGDHKVIVLDAVTRNNRH